MHYPLQFTDTPLVTVQLGITEPNDPVVGQLAVDMDYLAIDYLEAQLVLDCQQSTPFSHSDLDAIYCLLPDGTETVVMSRAERNLLARYTSYCYGQAWEAGDRKCARYYTDFLNGLCHTTKIRFEMKASPITDFVLLNWDAIGWAVTCLALFFGLGLTASALKLTKSKRR